MLVQVGTNEMLLDDGRRLALRASDAEVDVVLDITAKVPHVFQSFTGALDEADEALDRPRTSCASASAADRAAQAGATGSRRSARRST